MKTAMKSMGNYMTDGGNNYAKMAPPVHINLYLLISANYDSSNYIEAKQGVVCYHWCFSSQPLFQQTDQPRNAITVREIDYGDFQFTH